MIYEVKFSGTVTVEAASEEIARRKAAFQVPHGAHIEVIASRLKPIDPATGLYYTPEAIVELLKDKPLTDAEANRFPNGRWS